MDFRAFFAIINRNRKQTSESESGMLVRSFAYKRSYRKWISQNQHVELLKNIYTAFTLNKAGIHGDLPLHYFPLKNGDQVLIHQLDFLGRSTFSFLSDYFRERLMRLGYKLYLSDFQQLIHQSRISRIERHILHPRSDISPYENTSTGLYGLIELTVQYSDDKPLYLSIRTEVLRNNDSQPFPFDELAELLFI
ncbi:MAG: hypothetical protein ACK5B6_02635 [Bacteroidia bacterium]|jgi:hypothetical protein